MRARFAVLAAGALVCAPAAPAFAQTADLTPEAMAGDLAEVGSWKFTTRENGADGKPVCAETWRFDADGTGSVESGKERVATTWRTAQGEQTDRWLYTRSISTNGAPDCMGKANDPASYPREEGGFVVMFFNSGIALTCNPAAYLRKPDGTVSDQRLLRDEDCWGSLAPVPKGGEG